MEQKNFMTQNCMTCTHLTFDKDIGEYKCDVRHHFIHDPEGEATVCDEYKRNESIVEEN